MPGTAENKGLELKIPGKGNLEIKYLILDVNGTIAFDGLPIEGVLDRVEQLSHLLEIYVITADTFGTVSQWARNWNLVLLKPGKGPEDSQKERAILGLGANRSIAIGNGANDALMLRHAAIGICIMGREGASQHTMQAADLVIHDIRDALDLLRNPKRLIATLRR